MCKHLIIFGFSGHLQALCHALLRPLFGPHGFSVSRQLMYPLLGDKFAKHKWSHMCLASASSSCLTLTLPWLLCCSYAQQFQGGWRAVAVKIFPHKHRKHGDREVAGLDAARGLPHCLQMVEYFGFTPGGVTQESLYIITE